MTAKRVDQNQKEIVKRFRAYGLSVLIMSSLGKGAPDIAVGCGGMTFFFEIKNPDVIPSKQRLTPCEQEFKDSWRGHYSVIKTIDEVDRFILKVRNMLKFKVDDVS